MKRISAFLCEHLAQESLFRTPAEAEGSPEAQTSSHTILYRWHLATVRVWKGLADKPHPLPRIASVQKICCFILFAYSFRGNLWKIKVDLHPGLPQVLSCCGCNHSKGVIRHFFNDFFTFRTAWWHDAVSTGAPGTAMGKKRRTSAASAEAAPCSISGPWSRFWPSSTRPPQKALTRSSPCWGLIGRWTSLTWCRTHWKWPTPE